MSTKFKITYVHQILKDYLKGVHTIESFTEELNNNLSNTGSTVNEEYHSVSREQYDVIRKENISLRSQNSSYKRKAEEDFYRLKYEKLIKEFHAVKDSRDKIRGVLAANVEEVSVKAKIAKLVLKLSATTKEIEDLT